MAVLTCVYDTFDTFFNLPAVLIGIGNKIWEYAPGPNPKLDAVHAYWTSLGLLDNGKLTAQGRQIAEDSQPLIEYYLILVNSLLNADYSKDTAELPIPVNLRNLCNLANRAYYARHISPFWTRDLFRKYHGLLLDVCCGHGGYAVDWVKSHKSRKAIAVDLDTAQATKFERVEYVSSNVMSIPWTNYSRQVQVALLSETLCYFTAQERFSLIAEIRKTLSPNGMIVIHERNPNPVLVWMHACYRPGTGPLGSRGVAELMLTHGGEHVDSWRTVTHYGSCWKLTA